MRKKKTENRKTQKIENFCLLFFLFTKLYFFRNLQNIHENMLMVFSSYFTI